MILLWLIQLWLYISFGRMEGKESQSQSQFIQPQNSTDPLAANPRTSKPSHPVKSGTSHLFYKTRLCMQFFVGGCLKGKRCRFAHGDEDRRAPPPGWQDRIHEMSNDGQIVIDGVKHCNFIARGEVCPYGENCCYMHEIPSKNDRSETGQTEQNNTVYPSLENIKHIYQKSKICFKWDREGQCHYGERCRFVHGQPGGLLQHGNSRSYEVMPNVRNHTPPVIPGRHPVVIRGPTTEAGEKKWTLNRKKIIGIYGDWIEDPEDDIPPNN